MTYMQNVNRTALQGNKQSQEYGFGLGNYVTLCVNTVTFSNCRLLIK